MKGLLPLVPYDLGRGVALDDHKDAKGRLTWFVPDHPLVRDTPQAERVRQEWRRR